MAAPTWLSKALRFARTDFNVRFGSDDSGTPSKEVGLDRQASALGPALHRVGHQPMLEVMQYLRDNGFKTYIVTGGGQDFVRVYSQRVYGIPPEQVVGSMGGTKFGYDKDGKPFLTKEPKLL